MISRILLLIFLINFSIISNISAQTHYYKIPQQRFNNETINNSDIPWSNTYTPKKRVVSISDMLISHLITLKEYKEFLKDQKSKLPDSVYKLLIPNSDYFREGTFDKYMNETEFDLYPVPAVSWESAAEFCKWKTIKENEGDSISFIYRLPTKNEWLAAKYFLKNVKYGHDFGIYFSDWLFTLYDNSPRYYHDLNPDYSNNDKDPNMFGIKRRLVLGKSFMAQFHGMNSNGIGRFSDFTEPYISFRCVKDNLNNVFSSKQRFRYRYDDKDKKKETKIKDRNNRSFDSPAYYFLKKWDLLDKISFSNNKSDNNSDDISGIEYFSKNYFDYGYYKKSNKKKKKERKTYLKGENTDKGVLKYFGEIKNGKKFGDRYFFNKKGELTKHCYYGEDGKCIKQNFLFEQNKFDFKNKPTTQNIFEFTDSIQRITGIKGKIISDKKYAYESKNGRRNGFFTFSDRGDANVAGRYVDNIKLGTWCMWDSNEKLILQRNYKNGFEFETVYTTAPRNKLTQILDGPKYKLKLNKEGYCDYYKVQEKDVVWSKRVWRTLTTEDNEFIFKKFPLLEILLKHLKSGEITAYEVNRRDMFQDTIPIDVFVDNNTSDLSEIYEYRISEDNFFDCSRTEYERRILSITPVTKNKETGEKRELFNIYIPETRKYFAQYKLSDPDLPDHIKTLDDVFFFRYYAGMIFKESNVYSNRKISDYITGKGIELEAKRIENQILEYEYIMLHYYNNGN